jgi:nicotinate-nucleotide adenylyltransferase
VRLGVFGGEFDPPHLGHLAVARAAIAQLGLDRLLVVPAGQPPHRTSSQRGGEQRLALCEAAFGRESKVEVTDIELRRDGPSYTVDTLEELSGEGELFLVIGADQYAAFDQWRSPDRIRRLATLAVAPRTGFAVGPDAVLLEMAPVDLSSSELRDAMARGEPVADQLAAPVAELIERAGMYAF